MANIRTIDSWEKDGKITPQLLHEWAYDDNAVFLDQDEDLLLHDIDLLPTIIQLIADNNCPKRELLFYIVSYYTTLNFRHKRDKEISRTKEIISENIATIKNNTFLTRWAQYFDDTFKLVFNSKNITKDDAEKFGYAILKGLSGVGDLTPAKQIDNYTWEIIYLASSLKPFIQIDIKTGNFKYMGYK